jgi:inhibitor of cysteine peptidase
MLRISSVLLAAALALATGAGCGSGRILFTEAQDGEQVQVAVGEEFSIRLPGNPSTGYSWEPQDLDASLFEQAGEPEFESSDPSLVGAGGDVTLTFRVLKAGTASLTLVYHRPWETDAEPADTFTLTVTAR